MSAPTAKSKRGPTVLMTDSRDSAPRQQQRPSSSLQRQATGARLISVDNILQYASDIPSQQRRGPPATRPVHHSRTPSGRHPLDPKLSGRLIPAHMPTRSSKLSEKLVLLPETNEDDEGERTRGPRPTPSSAAAKEGLPTRATQSACPKPAAPTSCRASPPTAPRRPTR